MATAMQNRVSDVRFSAHEYETAKRLSDFVPRTFTELYDYYYDYVVAQVRSAGIVDDSKEDVAQSILKVFLEKDVLSDFDPNWTGEYAGVTRKAVFSTFLSGFVRTYVQHYRNRQTIHIGRESLSCDYVLGYSDEDGSEITWGHIYAPRVVDSHEDLDYEMLMLDIRTHLGSLLPTGKRNLLELFNCIEIQMQSGDKIRTAALAEHFGVTSNSILNWMVLLRAEISKVLSN